MPKFLSHPYLLLTLTVCFWSSNVVTGRYIADQVPPVALSFLRWTLALAVLAPFGLHLAWAQRNLLRRQWRLLALLAVTGVGLFNTLQYTALGVTSAINVAMINAVNPVLIVLVAWLLAAERPSRWQVAGIALALAGVTTIIGEGDPAVLLALRVNWGDLLALLAMLLWALYSVWLRRLSPALSPLAVLTVLVAGGTLVILPMFLAERAFGPPIRWSGESLAAIAYIAVFPSVVAYLFWNRGVRAVGASTAGLFLYLFPVIGTGLAVLLLGEALHPFHLVGVALVFAGIGSATILHRRAAARAAVTPAR